MSDLETEQTICESIYRNNSPSPSCENRLLVVDFLYQGTKFTWMDEVNAVGLDCNIICFAQNDFAVANHRASAKKTFVDGKLQFVWRNRI